MTQNQINYWKMENDKQHNSRVQDEVERSNKMREHIDLAKNAETNRHNLASEAETYLSNRVRERQAEDVNAETARSNREREKIDAAKAAEIKRSNLVTEEIGWKNLDLGNNSLMETKRSNLAKEAETERTHRANEEIARTSEANKAEANRIAQQNADTARLVAEETSRANKASEGIQSTLAGIQAGRLNVDAATAAINNDLTKLKTSWEKMNGPLEQMLTRKQIEKVDAEIANIMEETKYIGTRSISGVTTSIGSSMNAITRILSKLM